MSGVFSTVFLLKISRRSESVLLPMPIVDYREVHAQGYVDAAAWDHPLKATSTAPVAMSITPIQLMPDSFSPRKMTPKIATSTTLILSIGATRAASDLQSAEITKPRRPCGKPREHEEQIAAPGNGA